ncbi:MAG: hypothetical protein MJ171_04655 [Clostridia bacterium]|nr:hypothetical protein [Clostridia bacterium]
MFTLPEYRKPDFEYARFLACPDCRFVPAPKDGVCPPDYHANSIFPEYFKVDGKWYLGEDSRMDAVPVWNGKGIDIVEPRKLKKGDLVAVGRTENGEEGIYVNYEPFAAKEGKDNTFAFRTGRTRETSFTKDYKELIELLRYEKENNGYVVWVLGPACSFDIEARRIMAKLIEEGYCQALLSGNALATHDLEAAYFGTALGCDIETQKVQYMGHYNHLDLINTVKLHGSIKKFVEEERISDGIIASCVRNDVPFVLTSSVRDDGPLPEVYANSYEGQNAYRDHVRRATTVIGMATMLHTIATGNMTPSFRVLSDKTIRPVYFYMVDSAEFVANKLQDRGSLSSKGIVTNVQDFLKNLERGLF